MDKYNYLKSVIFIGDGYTKSKRGLKGKSRTRESLL